jgi:CDP-4-dehydro-6-deoxyglucose reductase
MSGTLTASVIHRKGLDNEMLQLQLQANNPIVFKAGQYFLFHINGKEYPYSVASAPDEPLLEFHIQNTTRHPLDEKLWQVFKNETQFELSGPFGEAYLRQELNLPIILIAGGGGFSQIQSILKSVLCYSCEGGNPKRTIHLYWGVRSSDLLYRDALCRQFAAQSPHFHYIPVVSDKTAHWQGRTGLVHEAVLQDFGDLLLGAASHVVCHSRSVYWERCCGKRYFFGCVCV